jgi:hypothetical protein
MRIVFNWHIYCLTKVVLILSKRFHSFTTCKTEILSVNFPKMFKLQNHTEYEAVTKEKTIYKFKIYFAVPFYMLFFRIITSCNGHYAPMDAQQ